MAFVKFCPHCGAKIGENINYCPSCGSVISTPDETSFSSRKKEKVIGGSGKKNKNIIMITLVVIVLITLSIFYTSQPSKETKIINDQPEAASSKSYSMPRYDQTYSVAFTRNGKIILPLNLVIEKKIVKFDLAGTNYRVPILAYISEGGKLITAISMCEPCNSTDFHIEGKNIICNSCGTTWNQNDLEAVSGSCGKYPPDPIPSKIVGKEIQIDENLVISWKRRV